VEGFLDKLGDDRAEGGMARGHEDGPPALVHQAVHRSVESLVYRQRTIEMESTAGLVWLRMEKDVLPRDCRATVQDLRKKEIKITSFYCFEPCFELID